MLQLVHGKKINKTECLSAQLGEIKQPILLPFIKPYTQGNSKSLQGAVNTNVGDSQLGVSNMVPRSFIVIGKKVNKTSGNKGNTGSKKRKISAFGKQALRSFLKMQGLNSYVINIIMTNKQRTRRKSRYNSIQQEYVNLHIAPAINQLRSCGPSELLPNDRLTTKTFWLIAVTGFLRASDIHRMHDARSRIESNALHLVYKAKISKEVCPTPHIKNSEIMVNRLFRPKSTPIPKARAIGATLVADLGVSTGDIVLHAL
ncbi:hypothetical protein BB561_004978 [Smittium simulii]|uniref:Uncharacterized protein n=1 Tax=Smittium simulii TaxID=133385 RepID=A0A2T9YCZ5_9FUNG|nr:hypothetical protein BB561_004978 [Smittium simulii]